MSRHHEIWPEPQNVHWGFHSAELKPVLAIESGDLVTLHTVTGSELDQPPPHTGLAIMPEQQRVFSEVARGVGPHTLTGPIEVAGAEPGDSVAIEVLDMQLRADWGFTRISPGRGSLPQEYPDERRLLITIDKQRRVVRMPWGTEIPAEPFFGVIGTAPPPEWGSLTSVIPRAFGGNLDVKEIRPGAVLHLPVFVPGALISVGDGHAAQGNGEVCVTAVESALSGTFRITLNKGVAPDQPWIDSPTHLIALGLHEDLDEAALMALRALIRLVCERTSLEPADAYMLCSVAADFHISQMVNVNKGVHAMLAKQFL